MILYPQPVRARYPFVQTVTEHIDLMVPMAEHLRDVSDMTGHWHNIAMTWQLRSRLLFQKSLSPFFSFLSYHCNAIPYMQI